MVRSIWTGALVVTLAWAGVSWSQQAGRSADAQKTMTVFENGRELRCRVIAGWRTASGAHAYQLNALATGETLTLVEDGPPSSFQGKTGKMCALSMKIYHWGRLQTSPAGAPVPPTHVIGEKEVRKPVIISESDPVIINVGYEPSQRPGAVNAACAPCQDKGTEKCGATCKTCQDDTGIAQVSCRCDNSETQSCGPATSGRITPVPSCTCPASPYHPATSSIVPVPQPAVAAPAPQLHRRASLPRVKRRPRLRLPVRPRRDRLRLSRDSRRCRRAPPQPRWSLPNRRRHRDPTHRLRRFPVSPRRCPPHRVRYRRLQPCPARLQSRRRNRHCRQTRVCLPLLRPRRQSPHPVHCRFCLANRRCPRRRACRSRTHRPGPRLCPHTWRHQTLSRPPFPWRLRPPLRARPLPRPTTRTRQEHPGEYRCKQGRLAQHVGPDRGSQDQAAWTNDC